MKCAVWDCLNDSGDKSAKLSFFSFPKDEAMMQKWLSFCKSNKKRTKKSDKVCMKHFRNDDIDGLCQFEMGFRSSRHLKPGAIPTIPTSKIDHEQEKIKHKETIASILREHGIGGEPKGGINKFVSPIKRTIYSYGSSRNIAYKSISITKKRIAIPIVRKIDVTTKPKTSAAPLTIESDNLTMSKKEAGISMVNKIDGTTKQKISASMPAIFTIDPLILKKKKEVTSVINNPKTSLPSPAPSLATNTVVPPMSKKETVPPSIIDKGDDASKRKTSPSTPANYVMDLPISKKKKEIVSIIDKSEISMPAPAPAPTLKIVVKPISKKQSVPSIADKIVIASKEKISSNAPASEIANTSPTSLKKQVAVPIIPKVSQPGEPTISLPAAAIDIEEFLPPVSKIINPKTSLDPLKLDDVVIKVEDDETLPLDSIKESNSKVINPKASLNPLKIDDVVIKIEDDETAHLDNIKRSNSLPQGNVTKESNICIKQGNSKHTDPKLKILDYGANMQELESLRNEVKALKHENIKISRDKAALQRQIMTLKDDNKKLYYHLMRNNRKHMKTLMAFEKSVSDADIIIASKNLTKVIQ